MSSPSSEERARSLIGRVLSDRYRLDGLVAMGSMGAVYRGLHLKMRKEVAIKVLHPEAEDFPELVQRFEREAIVGAHIQHPNIALASDMGSFDQGSYFLVLELVKGRTLRELIDDEAPLAAERATRIAIGIARALGAAHARGVIHRDLKPLNVMIDEQDSVKLIDFGLARVPVEQVAPLDEDTSPHSVSLPGVVFGTVATMAPEILMGMDQIDERSDLYALGIILYEMLTAKHPFELGDAHAVMAQHRSAPVPPFKERNPAVRVPPALEAVVMRLLEKEKSARYQDAPSLLEALQIGLGAQNEGPSQRAFEARAMPLPERTRRTALIAAATLVGAVGLLLALSSIGRDSSRRDRTGTQELALEPQPPSPPASASAARDIAAELRADLIRAASERNDAEGGAVLVALADADPAALKDATLRTAATKVAVRVADRGGPDAAQAYYALSYRFGAQGLDVLYDVSLQQESAKARARAAAIMDVQAKTDRPSRALRVILQLEAAKCREKPLLFARAASDGDARMLRVLKRLRPPECDPDGDGCCFRKHLGLEKAIDSLEARASER